MQNRQINQYFWTSAHLSGKFHMASGQTKAPISFAIEWSWTVAQSAPANQTNQVSQRISRTAVSSTWDGSPTATLVLLSPFPSHVVTWAFWTLWTSKQKIEKHIKVNNSRKVMESMERVRQVSAYIAVFWWQNTHGDSCPKFLRPWQNGVEIICCSELSEQDAEQTLPVYVVVCRWTDHASQGENCGLHFQLDAVPKGRQLSQTVMRRKKPSGFELMRNHGKTEKTWKAKEWSENIWKL